MRELAASVRLAVTEPRDAIKERLIVPISLCHEGGRSAGSQRLKSQLLYH